MLWKTKIEAILQHVIQIAKPKRVILFGSTVKRSRARDVDLLIVVPNNQHPRKVAQELYRSVPSQGVPVDYVVVTEDQFDQEKDEPWSVVFPATKEGKILYVA